MKTRSASIVTGAMVAVMAAVPFTMTGTVQAQSNNVVWNKSAAGTLKITAPTEVGGTLLEPGSYEVKVRNTVGASVVEFARWTDNPYAQEGLPTHEREVVATVNAIPQGTASAARQTGLLLASSGGTRAIALQIRGENVEYGF